MMTLVSGFCLFPLVVIKKSAIVNYTETGNNLGLGKVTAIERLRSDARGARLR